VVSLRIFSAVPPTEQCALRSTQPLEVSTRDPSWGKGGRCVWLTTYHPCSAETSRKSGALICPEHLGPPWPVAGDLYFFSWFYYKEICSDARYMTVKSQGFMFHSLIWWRIQSQILRLYTFQLNFQVIKCPTCFSRKCFIILPVQWPTKTMLKDFKTYQRSLRANKSFLSATNIQNANEECKTFENVCTPAHSCSHRRQPETVPHIMTKSKHLSIFDRCFRHIPYFVGCNSSDLCLIYYFWL